MPMLFGPPPEVYALAVLKGEGIFRCWLCEGNGHFDNWEYDLNTHICNGCNGKGWYMSRFRTLHLGTMRMEYPGHQTRKEVPWDAKTKALAYSILTDRKEVKT